MRAKFEVRVVRFSELEELEGVWGANDFLALLELMEFGDASGIDADELRDMCLLSLQDLKPRDAAALLLRYKLGEKLSNGEIDNMSSEMLDEKLWEEDSDMTLHEQLFNVGSLLSAAFPTVFPETDAVRVTLQITAGNESAEEVLSQPLSESFLVRLLADGMDDSAALHRLFDEQLAGQSFPEADSIVWTVHAEAIGDNVVEAEVISSGYWLDSLRNTRSYDSSAYADG
ncbi:MAG: hypothetical protein OER85_12940 [Gammaproteobacteria bacterium]|nr:hypothetical protein [Gammaproteobacteria bacterium]